MGEEETVTEVAKVVANGTTAPEEKDEDVPVKEDNDGVNNMEEDGKDDEKVGTQGMDVDKEAKENKDIKEEEKEGKEEKEDMKEEVTSEAMEEEVKAEENETSEENAEDKVDGSSDKEDKVDGSSDKEERVEESKQEKGTKKRGKGRTVEAKPKSDKKEVKEKGQKTPIASTIDRPVRERKSVERLVTSIERESVKEFHIEKGHGTALKDIPNVAYKLSKKKADDTFKLLHTILFGRRGKAIQLKSNISRFSGFVWKANEEKQKLKVKEKFDKCVKEKLLEFCDLLDIPIAKATTRKEDIVVKLMDFLLAPHATTTELLFEKEQTSKGKKRKRAVKQSVATSGSKASKTSAKGRRKIDNAYKEMEKSSTPEVEHESDEEEEEEEENEEEENANGIAEHFKKDVPEHSESEEEKDESEDESEEEDMRKDKRKSKKLSAKKEPAGKTKAKKIATPRKSTTPTKRTPLKSSSKRSKVVDSDEKSPKTSTSKKRTEAVKEKSSLLKKPAPVEKIGKKIVKAKDKPKENKLKPSDDELRDAICEILKEVDFNTATFTDILKQLAGRFKTDLTPRKSSIKLMIQDELTKLADEADDEEDEEDVGKDEAQPSGQGVEA